MLSRKLRKNPQIAPVVVLLSGRVLPLLRRGARCRAVAAEPWLVGSARLCSRTRGQQQPSFGVRAVLLVGIVEQWRMATTCSVRQHSAGRCGDNVRRLAAIPRPSPGESMLRLVVHSIAGRRQSEQRSPIALSHRCACCAAHSLPHILGLACAGSVETCQNGRFDFGTYQTRLQSSWQVHRRLAPNVLLLATASSQAICARARPPAAERRPMVAPLGAWPRA